MPRPLKENTKPVIAITCGDPAGIGPEVALKAAGDRRVRSRCWPVLVGPRAIWQKTAERLGLDLGRWDIEPTADPRRHPSPGECSAISGTVAAEAVVAAAVLCLTKKFSAMATAPISKKALGLAGYRFPGHTELLAGLSGVERFAMMFVSERHRVTLVTTHRHIAELPQAITRRLVAEKIELTAAALKRWWGIKKPRILVMGLNPHAGESGLLGSEEKRIILPAIEKAASERIQVWGPVSAESAFRWSAEGRADALVAMYHDQGLLPLKVLGGAVNLTLGLPFVRTSPDHGTAQEIAGKGIADPGPMIEAVLLAASLSGKR